ncbi:hypothetical protein VNI00_009719 [Paramarasmius palmivorus]|uniref:Uncharacterized protein n=1 Tax=Paramarasmius palmivorus TaxID=297713 RepID=A0AAW0CMU8_9AGAR
MTSRLQSDGKNYPKPFSQSRAFRETLLGGPHACIERRFAFIEMEALSLNKAFESELAVPNVLIKKVALVQRPPEARGNKLPFNANLVTHLVQTFSTFQTNAKTSE